MKSLLLTALLFLTPVIAADLEQLTGLQGSEYHLVKSKVVDHDYHIFVKVPEQASAEKDKKWPVVYLLDGGNTFPILVPYAKYMNLLEEVPPVIMVGISYGTDDWKKGNKRGTDFTLPADSRTHYGGAEQFHQFLTTELMPMIENNYSVDPDQRILFGHSLGGQFGIYAAMFQPQTFSGIIASNPAIHRNTDLFLVDINNTKHQPVLFIMQAENDNQQFQTPRKQWLDYWQEKSHHWQLHVMTAQGHNHMSSLPSAFRQGMIKLFSQPPEP